MSFSTAVETRAQPGMFETMPPAASTGSRAVAIASQGVALAGELTLPRVPSGVVLFAHGSGSSRLSPRNRFVAAQLVGADLATLLVDLLTSEEERIDEWDRSLRFDIPFLARRLALCDAWLEREPTTASLPIGYFGASTGAAAALMAAAERPERVGAVVSRGGRPDLAGEGALARVRAPTRLIVGGADTVVLDLNERALRLLPGVKSLEIVPGAGHLFEETGALEQVARLARDWFARHLAQRA